MNKEKFKQLQQDLIKHHIDCEGNACTSHPIFCVQSKTVVWGVDPDYSWDVQEIYDNNECESYKSVSKWLADIDECDQEPLKDYLLARLEDSIEDIEEGNSLWDKSDLISAINDYHGEYYELTLCHGKSQYEDVDFLLTRTEAEAYIERWGYKLHSPRIYVKSLWQNDYMREFIKAIIDGDIVWNDDTKTTN
ncbi:hypothetical protein VPH5P1C_0243 [Vibrio phage 5P1c]